MSLLIKGGTIVTPSDTFKADLLIEGEKISAMSRKINPSKDMDVIDATNMYVIPAGIDVHTHFQLPVKSTVSADDFEAGSKAAACGGVTTFIDFAHHRKGQPPLEALEERIEEAKDKVYIDYSLHMGLSEFNDNTYKTVLELIKRGIPSFKLYMIYAKEGWMSDDAALYSMLSLAKEHGGLIMVHAENPFLIDYFTEKLSQEGHLNISYLPQSRPNFVEAEAIKRALFWTEITKSRIYIVHVSTAIGSKLILEAKGKGVMAFGETCPQYLTLTEEIYKREDAYLFTCNPPLRKEEDRQALWEGLAKGALQVISTDHCSFTKEQRSVGKDDFTKLPNGLAGIETLLPLTYFYGVEKGRISLNQWVELISTNPAKLFGLYPMKGTLAIGTDADVVIFDPSKEVTIKAENLHYNIKASPYEGMLVKGWVDTTICRGNIVYRKGLFTGKKGYGRFIRRFYK